MKNIKETNPSESYKPNSFITSEEFSNFDFDASALTALQVIQLSEPTPENEIEIKTDSNGRKYKSVKASYMKKRLNLIFNYNLNFEILDREYIGVSKEVLVHGRLTIKNEGRLIIREQFGKHILGFKLDTSGARTSSTPVDIGNAYKSAASDAFKKCASEIGLCWDIYSQTVEDSEEAEASPKESYQEKTIRERLKFFLDNSLTEEDAENAFEQFKCNNKTTSIHEEMFEAAKNRIIKSK